MKAVARSANLLYNYHLSGDAVMTQHLYAWKYDTREEREVKKYISKPKMGLRREKSLGNNVKYLWILPQLLISLFNKEKARTLSNWLETFLFLAFPMYDVCQAGKKYENKGQKVILIQQFLFNLLEENSINNEIQSYQYCWTLKTFPRSICTLSSSAKDILK